MQTHLMHNLIHDESGTRHIARVFHQGNKEIEQQNIRQEYNNTSHTTYNAIHQKVLQRPSDMLLRIKSPNSPTSHSIPCIG